MNNVWLKIRVWTKSILAVLILAYLLAFMFANSGKTVTFWYFFGQEPQTSLLFFTLFTFLFGVIVTLLVRAFFKTMRQIRELREKNRVAKLERENADMRSKAAMLKTREAGAPTPTVTDGPIE
jgi:uncharacterized integral membrane protein